MNDENDVVEVTRCGECPFCHFDAGWRADYPDRYPDLPVWDCTHPEEAKLPPRVPKGSNHSRRLPGATALSGRAPDSKES